MVHVLKGRTQAGERQDDQADDGQRGAKAAERAARDRDLPATLATLGNLPERYPPEDDRRDPGQGPEAGDRKAPQNQCLDGQ